MANNKTLEQEISSCQSNWFYKHGRRELYRDGLLCDYSTDMGAKTDCRYLDTSIFALNGKLKYYGCAYRYWIRDMLRKTRER